MIYEHVSGAPNYERLSSDETHLSSDVRVLGSTPDAVQGLLFWYKLFKDVQI